MRGTPSIRRSKTPTKDNFKSNVDANYSPSVTVGKKNNQINESNLKIALQLAEHHNRQTNEYRLKLEESKAQLTTKNEHISSLNQLVRQLQQQKKVIHQKYTKIKAKYRSLKIQKQNLQKPQQSVHQKEPICNIDQNKDEIECLQNQVNSKNELVNKLCNRVQQCESNTMQILRLVNVLQQKVQQLTMDNSLLRGMLHQNKLTSEVSNKSLRQAEQHRYFDINNRF